MMAEKKEHKLDLFNTVLPAIDRRQFDFYDKLEPDEKKAYTALIAMRAMSLTGDQNARRVEQILYVNDLVNVGFWELSKYPELQHKLLCLSGSGSKQYHPWVAAKSTKGKKKSIDQLFLELYPGINETELAILKSQYDAKGIRELAKDAGRSDAEAKQLYEDAKKLGS